MVIILTLFFLILTYLNFIKLNFTRQLFSCTNTLTTCYPWDLLIISMLALIFIHIVPEEPHPIVPSLPNLILDAFQLGSMVHGFGVAFLQQLNKPRIFISSKNHCILT